MRVSCGLTGGQKLDWREGNAQVTGDSGAHNWVAPHDRRMQMTMRRTFSGRPVPGFAVGFGAGPAIWLICALLAISQPAALWAQEGLTDPHSILTAHYEAIGGLDKLRAEESRFFEATIALFGLEGTIREWQADLIRKRQEVDLGVLKQTTGDNGEYAWTVDTNGKLQINRDEQTLRAREVDERMALFEHLNRDSKHFTLVLEGVEDVRGTGCYVIRIDNSINRNPRTYYIGKADFRMYKSILKEADHEAHTLFSDFREVDGLTIAFRQDVELLPIGQTQVVTLVKYESNPDIDPALFEPPGAAAKDYRFTNGVSAENVPFDYLAEHLFIDVTIGCDKRTWIIDSGASVTVIDTAYATELGIETAGNMKGYGAGTTVQASFAELPPFSVDGIEFDSQRVAVIGISDLLRRAGIEVVGILGYDFLSRFVVKIDYAKELLSFYDPAGFKYGGKGRVIDRPMKERFFIVPMTVDGEYSGDWTLDIGAGGTSFFYPFAVEQGLIDRKGVESMAGGAGGYHPRKTIKFDSVEIGEAVIDDPLISVPLQTGGALGSTEGIGNLGNNVLQHFVLYLDYERQNVILERGDNFGSEFPSDKSGLALAVNDDGGLEVFYVSPHTPADRAGFRQGDILKSVNDIPIEYIDGALALRELLRADMGTEYRFEVERSGGTRRLNLKLRNLF